MYLKKLCGRVDSIYWNIEAKKHIPFFISLFIIESILIISTHIWDYQFIEIVNQFFIMLAWSLIVIYIVLDYYSFFYSGKDLLMHLVPISQHNILFRKSLLFFIACMVFFGITTTNVLINLPDEWYQSIFNAALIVLSTKALSLISFFALLIGTLSLVKKISSKILSVLVLLTTLFLIPIIQIIFVYNSIDTSNKFFSLGISSQFEPVHQYFNILPLLVFETDQQNTLADTVVMSSIYTNILVVVLCFTFFMYRQKYGKDNFGV